jgi:hypothetical protein
MTRVTTFTGADWCRGPSPSQAAGAADELEGGALLLFDDLGFRVDDGERVVFSPAVLASSKNVSFDPRSGRLAGTTLRGADARALGGLMARFSDQAAAFLDALLPRYRGRFRRARASFRPAEIAGRVTSWRKDDTRLHVDAFPASPVGRQRILRVFSNVNPDGRARSWRVGDDFEAVAARFAPSLSVPLPGVAALLALVRATRSRRTAYDALMLQLHDCMKRDAEFQATTPQRAIDFPPGSTWIAFTDEVSHAAMAGQYQLEQTFLVPVDAMARPERSPLRVLERLTRRGLV